MDLQLFARGNYRPFPGHKRKPGEPDLVDNNLRSSPLSIQEINDMLSEYPYRPSTWQLRHEYNFPTNDYNVSTHNPTAQVKPITAPPPTVPRTDPKQEADSLVILGDMIPETVCPTAPEIHKVEQVAPVVAPITLGRMVPVLPKMNTVRQGQPPKSLQSTVEKKSNNAISYDQLKVISPWEIQSLCELNIKKTLNQHGELYLKAVLTEAASVRVGLQEETGDQIKVYTDDGTEKSWVFKGRLKEVNVSHAAGVCTINAYFLSETITLDIEKKSRSFQNTALTYDQIVTKVLGDYPGKSVELTALKEKINGPLIQYQETDWQFIRRLASYLETVIVPDVTVEDRIFSFGYPAGVATTLPDDINYATGKDIKAYYVAAEVNPDIPENYFAYYEVETYQPLNIGDTVSFKGQEMQVSTVTIELIKGLLIYHTTLVKKIILRQNPIYNSSLQGVSLTGTILEGRDQEIKLHLDIDTVQNPAEAYWYPFAPSTTDALYLMPQMGTIATLYIPGKQEQQALITGCLRTNGADCKQTSDPNTRYLATEYGQELKLAPGGIYLTAGQAELCLHFDDQEGVILKSHKEMVLTAKEDIVLEAAERVIFSSPNQIIMATPMGSLVMENELHLHASKVHVECTDTTKFSQVEAERKEESKGGIDWGEMCAKAKGAVATWWDNVDGWQVAEGGIGVISGVIQVGAGYTTMMVSGATALGGISTGVGIPAAIGFAAVAAVGFCVATDGVSTTAGGASKIVNGLCGYKDNYEGKYDWGLIEKSCNENGYGAVYYGIELLLGAKGISNVLRGALNGGPAAANAMEKFILYGRTAFEDKITGIRTSCDWYGSGDAFFKMVKAMADAMPKAVPNVNLAISQQDQMMRRQ